MSEKKRQKKDGERKDKKNQAMRDAVSERQDESSEGATRTTNLRGQGKGSTDNPRRRER